MEPLTDVRQISRIAYGYMASQALFTALEFGLFSKLSGTSKSLQTLAGDTGMEASELLPGITSVVTAKKKGCVSTASRREGAAICRQRRQGCAGGGATICRQRRDDMPPEARLVRMRGLWELRGGYAFSAFFRCPMPRSSGAGPPPAGSPPPGPDCGC